MSSLEFLILNNLINNKEYFNEVINHIKGDLFEGEYKTIINLIKKYSIEYQDMPSKEALKVSIDNLSNLNSDEYNNTVNLLKEISKKPEDPNYKWLVDETEKYCKNKAVRNALFESINILQNKDKVDNNILGLLEDALSVSFKNDVGYDYFDNTEKRLESYKEKKKKLPLNLDIFNKITNGGVSPKTLNMVMAATGVGKSIWLCDIAKHYLTQGLNVLYVSAEMNEDDLAKRIDANILNINQDELEAINIKENLRRIQTVVDKNKGKLIIKEYPTGSANALDIQKIINDLQLKKKIDVNILVIDYINIFNSYRFSGKGVNSYTIMKAVAEEMRGLGVKNNIPVFSATQSNRSGYNNDDVDFQSTSDSIGIPQTADLFLVLISSEELSKDGKIMFKQLKNRYADMNSNLRFIAGIDRAKSKFYDVDNSDIQYDIDKNDKKLKEKFNKNNTGKNEDIILSDFEDL